MGITAPTGHSCEMIWLQEGDFLEEIFIELEL